MISHVLTLTSTDLTAPLSRTLIVPEAATFADLHHLICAAFGFAPDGGYSFDVEPFSCTVDEDDDAAIVLPCPHDFISDVIDVDATLMYLGGPGKSWSIEVFSRRYSHRVHRRALLLEAKGATPPPGTTLEDWAEIERIAATLKTKGTTPSAADLALCEKALGTRSRKQIRIFNADPRRAKLDALTESIRSVVITGELQASPQFEAYRAIPNIKLPFWQTREFDEAAIAAARNGVSVPAFLADQLDIPGLDALVGAFDSTEQFGVSDASAATVGRAVKKVMRLAPNLRLKEEPGVILSFEDASRILVAVYPLPLCREHTIRLASIIIDNLLDMQLLKLDSENHRLHITAEARELTELTPVELGRALLDYYPVGCREGLIFDCLMSLFFLYSDLVFHSLADLRGVHITQVQEEFLDHVEEAIWPRQGGGFVQPYVQDFLGAAACLGLRDRKAPRGCIHVHRDVIGFLQEALRRALPEMLVQDRTSSPIVDAPPTSLQEMIAAR